MRRVLIVDDERDLVHLLRFNLERAGFSTTLAHAGREALALAQAGSPALVLLDLMLPDLDGLEVCRQLRLLPQTRQAMIVILSARSEESDRVDGFRAGADDYVTKPFSVTELVLRLEAATRRIGASAEPVLTVGPLRLEPTTHRFYVDDREVPLTALELRLLRALMGRPGLVQTREALLAEVWQMAPGVETRTVDTHVLRLRDKLGAARDWLQTVRGVGYRMDTRGV